MDRVDLVPQGSNPDAHIVLFKSKEGQMPAPKKKAAKKAPKADTRKKQKQRGDDEDEEEEEDDVAKSRDDEDDEEEEDDDEEDIEKSEDDEDEDDAADDDDEEEEEDEEDDAPRRKSAKTPAKKSKKPVRKASSDDDDDAVEDDEDDDTDDDDEVQKVAKALPKAAQRMFLKMAESVKSIKKTARVAERTARIEKERREKLEFVEKAKKDIPNLSGTSEEKGALIQALYNGEPVEKKTADAIVKLLKTGDAAVRSLMSETGRHRASDDNDESAIAQLREKAEEIRKADTKLTKEQAFEKACTQNPKLFSDYKVEKRRANRHNADDVQ